MELYIKISIVVMKAVKLNLGVSPDVIECKNDILKLPSFCCFVNK